MLFAITMRVRRGGILTWVVWLIFGTSPFPLGAGEKGRVSVVVYPAGSGDATAIGEKTAGGIRLKLGEFSSLQIIDPRTTETVLQYHRHYREWDSKLLREVREWLAKSKAQYYHFDYTAAGAQAQKVIDLYRENPSLLHLEGRPLLEAHLLSGMIHSAGKRKEEAVGSFLEVLSLNPRYEPDAEKFSPSLRRLFGRAKEEFLPRPRGDIAITAQPKVAEIYLNGIYQGVAPLHLAGWPAGPCVVSVMANKYAPQTRRVAVEEGQTTEIDVKLGWQGKNPEAAGSLERLEAGLRIGHLLKADKVILVAAGEKTTEARMIDRVFGASHPPLRFFGEMTDEKMAHAARLLFAQTQIDLSRRPYVHLDPGGLGDPIVLGNRKPRIKKGILWGGLGAAVVGGLIVGILAAGGDSPPTRGDVQLNFR